MPEHKLGLANNLLQDGEMRSFELDDQKVLLARVDGVYYALGATCTHYGAPLADGLLKGHTMMCPWHHACFDVRSGLRTEPPALNSLHRYEVRIIDGEVVVNPSAEQLTAETATETDERHFVIVGGGAAGNMAAEELRMAGFNGRITMISAVSRVPVDRPNLSKDYLAGNAEPDWIPLRSKDWYAKHDIDLRLATRVEQVAPRARQLRLSDGQTVSYDKLILATGSIPRQLDAPGHDLKGIYTLRNQDDADAIINEAESGQRVVVIGASFIGMEVAASLAGDKRGLEVMVVEMESAPYARILGDRVGFIFQQAHEAHGVQFKLERKVAKFHGDNDRVSTVELDNGEKLPTDFVVVGIGVDPATEFLSDSGLALDSKDHALLVDNTLRTSDVQIYAVGDIASYPNSDGQRERIEHWRVAEQQGMVAAHNMLGSADDINYHVPFFWTNQWDIRLRYVGHAADWDSIIYRGQPEEKDFIVFYLRDDHLLAAAGCNRNLEMVALEFALKHGITLTPEQLRDDDFDLVGYVRSQ